MPSLRAVLEMTLAEYYIRLDGYKRTESRKLFYWRRLWYNTLVGPHYDPKHLPKTEAAYLPIPDLDGKKEMTDQMKQMWRAKMAEYKNKKQGKDGS